MNKKEYLTSIFSLYYIKVVSLIVIVSKILLCPTKTSIQKINYCKKICIFQNEFFLEIVLYVHFCYHNKNI